MAHAARYCAVTPLPFNFPSAAAEILLLSLLCLLPSALFAVSFSHVSNPTQLEALHSVRIDSSQLLLPLSRFVSFRFVSFRFVWFRLLWIRCAICLAVSLCLSLCLSLCFFLLLPPQFFSFFLFFSAFFLSLALCNSRHDRHGSIAARSGFVVVLLRLVPPPPPHRRSVPLSYLSHIQLQSVYASMTFSIMHFAHFNVDKGAAPSPSPPSPPSACSCSISIAASFSLRIAFVLG